MGQELNDLVGHHVWATDRLLAYCRDLPAETLTATVPGTYGSIIATLRHLIDAEASYTYRLTGAWPTHPWREQDAAEPEVGLDVLADRAKVLAGTLGPFLAGEWDTERLGEARGGRSEVFAVRAGIFFTQLIHHANEHRAHVCSILGALGHEPPDVSAWEYAISTGRSWLKSPPAGD
jgi:uncharacterized damage-inducible protein DinB